MRKCIRWNYEMKEEYGLKISAALAGVAPVILSKGQGTFSKDLGKIKAAVCPYCGEVSLYIDDLKSIK